MTPSTLALPISWRFFAQAGQRGLRDVRQPAGRSDQLVATSANELLENAINYGALADSISQLEVTWWSSDTVGDLQICAAPRVVLYPNALPADVLATDIRNGHIDHSLSFPVEDLYADGQAPGQVGQEIYGAGAALVLASSAFHRVERAPLHIFCNHLLAAQETTGDRAIGLQLTGARESEALLAIIRRRRRRLPACHVTVRDGDAIRPAYAGADRIEFRLPGDAHVTLTWDAP